MSQDVINGPRRAFLGASAALLSAARSSGGRTLAAPADASVQADPVKSPAVIGLPQREGRDHRTRHVSRRNLGTSIVANLFLPVDDVQPHLRRRRRHPPLRRREGTDRPAFTPSDSQNRGSSPSPTTASDQGESRRRAASDGGPVTAPRRHQLRDRLPRAAPARRIPSASAHWAFARRQLRPVPGQIELRVKAVAAVDLNLGEARREGIGTISYEERMTRLRDAAAARSRGSGEPVPNWCRLYRDTAASFTRACHRSSIARATTTTGRLARGIRIRRTATCSRVSPEAHGVLPVRPTRHLSPRPLLLVSPGLQGRHAVLEPERHPESQGTEGTLHRRRGDAHGHVRPAAVRDAGRGQVDGILRPRACGWAMTVQLTAPEWAELNAVVLAIEVQGARLPTACSGCLASRLRRRVE